MAVETGNVARRRTLHFSNYQQILDEARSLAAQPTRQLGNWSLGQICEHLSAAINQSLDGAVFRPSWLVRVVGPFLKNRYLTTTMKPGFKLPKTAGPLIPGSTDFAAGLAALEKSIARLKENHQRFPHPVFGPLTREEWDQLQFRHSEMHLSFIEPE